MNNKKGLLIKDLDKDGDISSHLDREMYEQIIVLNKQINAIKQILEGSNEK